MPNFPFPITPVDHSLPVQLPPAFQKLARQNFHPDLLERVTAYELYRNRWKKILTGAAGLDGSEGAFARQSLAALTTGTDEFLQVLAEGYLHPFDAKRFWPKEDDRYKEVKKLYLSALSALSEEFGDRMPALVWEALACWGAKENPHEYATILASQGFLQKMGMPWIYVDTVLHAGPMVYGLWFHISSRIYETAGMVLEHNCDCGGCIYPPAESGSISLKLGKDRFLEATAALLTHLLGQFLLLAVLQLPQGLGVSVETEEIVCLSPAAIL